MKFKLDFLAIAIIILLGIAPGSADYFYAISGNEIISNDFKIVLTEPVISVILIDNNSIYFYTSTNLYSANKTVGTINYKVQVKDITEISLSDNNIFLKKSFEILTIDKDTGEILSKHFFNALIDKTFSFTTNTLSTFYVNVLGQPQLDSVVLIPGDNIVLSQDSINKTITITSAGTNDNTKVNKTGDDITGNLNCDNSMVICGFTSSLVSGGNIFISFSGIEPYYSSVLNRIQEKNMFAEVVNASYSSQTINNFKYDIWEGSNHSEFEFKTGGFDVYNNSINNLKDPVNSQNAATKIYVDNSSNSKVNKSGDIMVGTLTVPNINISVNNANTSYGYYAGYLNTGTYQTALGYYAGYNNTGNNSVFIGGHSGSNNTEDNQLIIKQQSINPTPLIKGNFSSGIINIPYVNTNASGMWSIPGNNITTLQGIGLTTNVTVLTELPSTFQTLQFTNGILTNVTIP